MVCQVSHLLCCMMCVSCTCDWDPLVAGAYYVLDEYVQRVGMDRKSVYLQSFLKSILLFGLGFGISVRAGNPVSTLVCFHLFVRPALHKLSGRRDAAHSIVDAKLAFPCKLDQERPEYHRVALTWESAKGGGAGGSFVATSTGMQRSSRLLSLRSATGLLCLSQGSADSVELPEGSIVPCILLSGSRPF